jgi:hypothetical protein
MQFFGLLQTIFIIIIINSNNYIAKIIAINSKKATNNFIVNYGTVSANEKYVFESAS